MSSPVYPHPVSADHRLKCLLTLKNLSLIGLFVPTPCVTYRYICSKVSEHIRDGMVEAAGDDPLDSLLNGLEASGSSIRTVGGPTGIDTRFVATMVLALRAALGTMTATEANKLVAGREYRRICRARNVRLVVIESNRSIVMDRYFKDDSTDVLVQRFSRLPWWLEFLVGFYKPAGFQSC